MGLETGTYINSLVATNPVFSDPVSAGDDHIRLLKATIKNTFPNISGAVTATHTELNFVDGVTSNIQTQIDNIDASGSVTFENINANGDVGAGSDQVAQGNHTHTVANITDLTASATELNYTDGVTSNIKTQLDGKQASGSYATSDASSLTSGTLSGARLDKTVGAVGTYIIAARNEGNGTARTRGYTTSGSSLYRWNTSGFNVCMPMLSERSTGNTTGSGLSGTWQLMGDYENSACGGTHYMWALWLRIN